MSRRARSVVAVLLNGCGGLLLSMALLAAGAALISLQERLRHGPGLLFAAVELFSIIALTCALLGGLALFGAHKLARRSPPDGS